MPNRNEKMQMWDAMGFNRVAIDLENDKGEKVRAFISIRCGNKSARAYLAGEIKRVFCSAEIDPTKWTIVK